MQLAGSQGLKRARNFSVRKLPDELVEMRSVASVIKEVGD
jgi:hypothetical protein